MFLPDLPIKERKQIAAKITAEFLMETKNETSREIIIGISEVPLSRIISQNIDGTVKVSNHCSYAFQCCAIYVYRSFSLSHHKKINSKVHNFH